MSDQTITLVILGLSIVVFVSNRVSTGIVALGVALSLWATGVLTLDQAIAGFGNQTVVLIAALFVVAEALDAAGITTWSGQQLVQHAGGSRSRLIILIMIAVAVLSALITPNGAVAAMFPLAVVLALRFGEAPSQLLMPVAFAAHAGSLLVLTGSPVTLLVSAAAQDATGKGLAFFEVALVGVPLLAGTILIALLFGKRLLPVREPKSLTRDLSDLPQTLLRQYMHEEELARATVLPGSPLIGVSESSVDLGVDTDVHLLSVQDRDGRLRGDVPISAGDVLVVRGSSAAIERVAGELDLSIARGTKDQPIRCGLVSRDFGVAEVIITPRSTYIGERVFPGMITESGKLVILAVQRHGEDHGTDEVVLEAGDSLLLQGSWDMLDQHTEDPNVLLVDSPDSIRRQTVPLGPGAVPALAVMALMIVVLTTGVAPAAAVVLVAAMAMVVLRVITVEQAHHSMSWSTLILVAGMIPLSTAITETGAAKVIADALIDTIGGGGPYLMMLGLFLLTVGLSQVISNTATALILIPIAVSVAPDMEISAMTLLMCVNVAAAAAVLTPIATPGNMMIMEPGGYQFGDFWKLGLPVLLVYLAVGVFLVPVIWAF